MNPIEASKHQKEQWIEDGMHLEELINDSSMWIQIAARRRKIQVDEKHRNDLLTEVKGSMDADLFEVIQLSAKTPDEIYKLILEDKFLTYFVKHHDLGVRIRAKKQLREYMARRQPIIY